MKTLAMRRLLLGTIFAAILALLTQTMFVGQTVNAQSAGGLRVSPTRYILEILPGATETIEIRVRNVVSEPLSVDMQVDNFLSDDDTGGPTIISDPESEAGQRAAVYSLQDYVTGPTSFDLAVGEEKILNYVIELPEDVSAGARFGLIRFNTGSTDGADQGVALSASVGTIVVVNTPGTVVERLSLDNAGAFNGEGDISSMFQSAPESLRIRLNNEGNTYVQPFGNVQVKNWSGEVIQEFEFNPGDLERAGLLPDSLRSFDYPLEDIGSFGKYEITASISYGDGSNIIPISASFWVIPWTTILIVLGGGVALLLVLTRGLRVYNRHILRDEKMEKRIKNK